MTHTGATVEVTINGKGHEGVDKPWFVLDRTNPDTVSWFNGTERLCMLIFEDGGNMFPNVISIPANSSSDVFTSARAPARPVDIPESQEISKVYHYSIAFDDGRLFNSPAGGVRP